MEDRRFTEVDLRRMLEHATGSRPDVVPGWAIGIEIADPSGPSAAALNVQQPSQGEIA